MSATVSPPPASPSTQSSPAPSQRKQILTFPGIANLFVSLKRAQARSSNSRSSGSNPNEPKPATVRSPPSSPGKAAKVQPVVSNSGDTLQTHPALAAEGAIESPRRVALEVHDTFVCAGAVDTTKLLRLSRDAVLERAQHLGANVLVDESWTCAINPPKNRSDHYRVQIVYTGAAARANRDDPRKPIALDHAKSVPGLMTIVSRA